MGSGGSPGRAGRDLRAAIGVSLVIGGAVIASVYLQRWTFVGIVILAVGFGLHELVAAVRGRGVVVPLLPIVFGGTAAQVLAWRYGAAGLLGGAVATAGLTAVWRLAAGPRWRRDALVALALTAYVPALAGCVVLLARPDDGARRILAFAVATVCSDVGAYATGVLFGRHYMAPRVSPNKTWEGFAGSLAACTVGGVLLLRLLVDAAAWQGVLFGLAVAVTATSGDLAESYLKRRLGIKDMGALLPGHGGVMDRADSLLPTALVSLVLLAAFAPPS